MILTANLSRRAYIAQQPDASRLISQMLPLFTLHILPSGYLL